MRTRTLLAALAALPLLSGCETAETARTVGHIVAAAEKPPIEDLCGGGESCLRTYYRFSSEAFGTGGLTAHYRGLEQSERSHRDKERAQLQRIVAISQNRWFDKCAVRHPEGWCIATERSLREDNARWRAAEYRERAEGVKSRREALQRYVAGWLAAYPTEREAYLAVAAAALGRVRERYCSDLPLRALDAERGGETWREMADRLGREAADRAEQAGELLPDPGYETAGEWLRVARSRFARRIEGNASGRLKPALVAPGYENDGERLLTAESCEGGER